MLRYVPLLLLVAAAPGTQSKPAADAPERSADASDKMICKRFVDTGSLVRGTRVCKTKADWERGRAEARANLSTSNGCASIAVGKGGC